MSDRHQIKPYPLRLSEDLRDSLATAAFVAGRSLNAEIASRLEWSFDHKPLDKPTAERLIEALQAYTAKLP